MPTGVTSYGGSSGNTTINQTTINQQAIRDAVRLVAVTNIALTGVVAVDGLNSATGDRIACVGQTDATKNLIYIANNAGAWTVAPDSDSDADINGMAFWVTDGSATYKGSGWLLNTPNPVYGVSALAYIRINGLSIVTAGNGLDKTGDTVFVNVDNTGIEINADIVRLKDGGVTNAKLAGSISDDKLASSYLLASGARALTGDQSFGGHKATNLADPAADTDGATKGWVNTQIGAITTSARTIATVGPPVISAPMGTLVTDRDGVVWIQVSPAAAAYAWIRYLGGPTVLTWRRCSETLRCTALSSAITQPTTTNNTRYFTPFHISRPCYIHGLGWPVSVAGAGAGDTIGVKAAIYSTLRTGGVNLLPEAVVGSAIFEAIGGANGAAAIGGTATGLLMVPLQTLANAGVFIKKPGWYWIVANFSPNSVTPPTPEGFTVSFPSPLKRGRSMAKTYSSESYADTLVDTDTADAATTTPAATDWALLIEEGY